MIYNYKGSLNVNLCNYEGNKKKVKRKERKMKLVKKLGIIITSVALCVGSVGVVSADDVKTPYGVETPSYSSTYVLTGFLSCGGSYITDISLIPTIDI